MEKSNGVVISKHKISSPVVKFIIGFFAGMCSTLFPRIIVLLNMSHVQRGIMISDIVVFNRTYLICAMLFSIIVGVAIMLLEWNVMVEPGKTFMTALSIPALISGGFNTNSAIDLYKDRVNSLQLEERIQSENPIPTIPLPAEKIKTLSKVLNKKSEHVATSVPLFGVPKAYAADSYSKSIKLLSFRVKEQLYVIILDSVSSAEEARNRANQIRPYIKEAEAVQVGSNQYFVILGGPRLPRTEALMQADQLRRSYPNLNLHPQLLPVGTSK